MERLMTTEEVAELLRIEPVTVRRLIARGELSAYRIAGEYRIAPEDLEKYLKSQQVEVARQRVEIDLRKKPFDKFNPGVLKVWALAEEEARQYNHPGVGTEHIVLALMTEGDGVAAKALERLQVQLSEVRAQIEKQHPAGDQPPTEGHGMTASAQASIERAVQEARSLGHHYLGTEHQLLGVLREEEGLGGQVLRGAGVTLEKAREVIKQLLASAQPGSTSEPE